MKRFLMHPVFKLISGTILVVLGVFIYSYVTPNNNILENIISSIVVPIQKCVAFISSASKDFAYQFRSKEELQAKNESLTHELNVLRDQTADYYSIKRENQRFKKYYGIKSKDQNLQFATGNVIGTDENCNYHTIMLDCGRNSGVDVGNAVITEDGFIGSVKKVNSNSCYVKTIISPGVNVSAEDTVTGDTGMINGSEELSKQNLSKMTFLPAQNKMLSGDIVCTSGVSGICPKGLKIGTVQSFDYDSKESYYYATIKPFQDIKAVRYVMVITNFTGKGELKLT